MRRTFTSYAPGSKSHSALYSGKRTIAALLGLLLIFSSCSPKYSETKPLEVQDEPVRLLILHTNDMHAQYIPLPAFWVEGDDKPLIGGFAAMDAYIDRERAKGLPTLLMDAGDLMTGTPISDVVHKGVMGGLLFDIMEDMGFDIMTLGNHEFDNGQENVYKFYDVAHFPIINANLRRDGKLITPTAYEIIEIAGLKVGVIGLMTEQFFEVVLKSNIEGLEFVNSVEVTQEIVNKIDPLTDLIVLLTHAGVDEDKRWAREIRGIDLIIGGHQHRRLTEPLVENNVLIVQTGSRTANLGRIEVVVQGDTISEYSGGLIALWVDSIEVDPEVAARMNDYENSILEVYGDTIAIVKENLVGTYRGESNVGSWVASIIKDATEADIGIMNSGGIRKSISAGPMRKLDIIEMLPFRNTLTTFELSGRELLKLLQFSANIAGRTGGQDLQFSGLSYGYRVLEDGAELVDPRVGGEEIDLDRIYKCGTIDFILFSQAETYFGFQPSNGNDLMILLSQVVINYCMKEKVIDAKLTGAIVRLEE